MSFISPFIGRQMVVTEDPMSFQTLPEGVIGIPKGQHPGAFGFERKHHIHEGVDLYVDVGTEVSHWQYGTVVAIVPFTGEHAGSPWWHNTWAVMIEYDKATVCYGEIEPDPGLSVGMRLPTFKPIGKVLQVLKKDKGRPMSMLHLEVYDKGITEPVEWLPGAPRPAGLRDPTPYLEYRCSVIGGHMVADCPKDFPACAFGRKGNVIECLRCESVWEVTQYDGLESAKLISGRRYR